MTTLLFATLALRNPTIQVEGKRVDLALIALSFDCPKDWIVTVNKKKEVRIVFRIPNTPNNAVMEIFPTNYVEEKEVWQLTQAAFAKQSKREMVRQWEEELLGVPLLLTRVNYRESGEPRTAVNGLLYNDSPRKLWYRLSSAPEDFDNADYAWRNVMLTLRTFDRKPLRAQVPGVKPDPKAPVVDLPSKPPTITTIDDPTKGRPATRRPSKLLELTVANRKVSLQLPSDWTASREADGSISLTLPNVRGKVRASLFSTLDSDPADKALFLQSSQTLNQFAKVDRRDESAPAANLAGGMLHSVWRRGTTATGGIVTCDASLQSGEFYILLNWQADGTVPTERSAVEALLRELTLVPVP